MIKPHVGVFSDSNFLALSVLENLIFKRCYVSVFTNDTDDWEQATLHLNRIGNFEIAKIENKPAFNDLDYCIFVCGFLNINTLYQDITKLSRLKFPNTKKSILVLPLEA